MDSSQNIDGFENPLSEFEGFGRTRRTRTDEATERPWAALTKNEALSTLPSPD